MLKDILRIPSDVSQTSPRRLGDVEANILLSRGEQSVGWGRTIRWVGANIPLSRGEQSVGWGRTIRWVGANIPLSRGEQSVGWGRTIRLVGADIPLSRGEQSVGWGRRESVLVCLLIERRIAPDGGMISTTSPLPHRELGTYVHRLLCSAFAYI